jgi:hypothetical protein
VFSATAFVCVYNEADILHWVLAHLVHQGLHVHVIDNWSTDGSDTIAHEFPLVGFERFPVEGPSQYYSWTPLLERVDALAAQSTSDWCMLNDADEIRRTNREGERLLEGFQRVQQQGYNTINFQVYHFKPTDDNYQGNPEWHFQYYSLDSGDCHAPQLKAWRNTHQYVNLSQYGGHTVKFPGMSIFPEKFILKHYPLRTSEQAARKVLRERLPRYDPCELEKRWHVQYQGYQGKTDWIERPEELSLWE